MSAGVEINDAIYTVLNAGLGGVKVYHLQAPEDEPLPYVVYSWQGGGRTDEVPDLINRLEFVRVYASTSYAAGVIDGQIAALLDNVAIPVTGWTTVSLMRQDDFETVETPPDNVPTYTMGAIYRLILDR